MHSAPSMESIPNFIRAKSPQGLRRLMRRNNLRRRGFVQYNIIFVESEKLWYAWYYLNEEKMTVEEKAELDE